MSDSSYKLTASSRRKPAIRRVLARPRPKSEQPKVVVREQARSPHPDSPKRPQPTNTNIHPNHPQARVSQPALVPKRRRPIERKAVAKPAVPSKQGKNPPRVNPQSKNINVYAVHPTQVRTVPGDGGYPRTGKKTVRVRKQPLPKRAVMSRRSRLKPMARNLLYALRLLIIGVGMSAIVGTALSVLDPAARMDTANSANPTPTQASSLNSTPAILTQEIPTLKTAIQNLINANANLAPGVFVLDLTTGAYVDINAGATFAAASTIKIPILIAFFQEVDAGNIRLDETMTMKQEFIAGGSGDMQYKPVGTKYTALEVAAKMMTISDNTATNMLIDRLGGAASLNQRFQSWGLTTTQIRNDLPDLEGTNTTTPKELGLVMTMLNKGNLVSMVSRDRMLEIMRETVRDTMLPSGIGEDAKIAHKTGDIRSMIGDAGLIDIPSGKRYAIAVMVQRPDNDPRGERLVGSISRTVYQSFTQSPTQINPPNNSSNNPQTSQNGASPGVTPTPTIYNPTLPNTNIPSTNIPIQNRLTNPSFNPNIYQTPVISPQMTTPSYQTYQTPVVTPQQYYYPYQR